MKSWHSLPATRVASACPSGRAGKGGVGHRAPEVDNTKRRGPALICRFAKPAGCSIGTAMSRRLTADLGSSALAEALADIAEDAARVILPYWRSGVVAESKADDSPVTQADREAEALILGAAGRALSRRPGRGRRGGRRRRRPGRGRRLVLADRSAGRHARLRRGPRELHRQHRPDPTAARPWPGSSPPRRRRPPGAAAFPAAGRSAVASARSWQPIKVRNRPESPTALLSHSMSDEEAKRLASRHGCVQWQGTDSSLKSLPDRGRTLRRLSAHRPDVGMGHGRGPRRCWKRPADG